MIKKLLIFTACVMVAGALPVFATGQKENTQSTGAAASSGPSGSITVSWWGAPIRNEKTNAVIKLFEKAYPNVTVQGVNEGWTQYWQKLTVEASAHSLPCVTQTQSRQLLTYTNEGVFLPLDNLISAGKIDVSQMSKGVLDSGQGADGKVYMIPYGAAYFGFIYNKTLAEKAGLKPLPAIYTWAQFESWLTEAKGKLPAGVYPIMQNGFNSDPFLSYVHDTGYSLFSKSGQLGFPESVLRDYWSIWLNFAKQGITIPEDLAVQESTGSTIEQSYLVHGKVMVESAPGNQFPDGQKNATQLGTGTLGMMMYPSGSHAVGGVLVTNGFSIPTTCTGAKQEAAAAFINFWTNNAEAAKVFASDNGVVTDSNLLQAQINDPSLSAATREYLQVFDVISKHNPPVELYAPGYTAVFSTLYTQVFQQIASGKLTLDQGVKTFFAQAKQQLSN